MAKNIITLLLLLSTFVHASSDDMYKQVLKTSCIQQSEHAGKTLDEQKKVLIEQAKREALEELYGTMIFSATDIKDGKLTSDEIRSRAVGSVRVKGNPHFYNGQNLGSICSDVNVYITKSDLEKYTPKEVKLSIFCFNDPSVAIQDIKDEARAAAYKEMIVKFKPSLKNISKEQAEKLIHGFKESNSNFDLNTASYCFDSVGIIMPYELEMSDKKATNKNVIRKKEIYKSCKDIKKQQPNSKNGVYIIKPHNIKIETYCDMDTDGGGWTQFGYLNHKSNNFRGSVNIGTFKRGTCNNKEVCSLDVNILYKSNNEQFDLMIKYGKRIEFSKVFKGFYKDKNQYFLNPTFKCCKTGEHGMIGDHNVDGYYATYCASAGGCKDAGNDYFNFSLNGVYPDAHNNVICGFYGVNGSWKECPSSDNKEIMKYFIREK